MRRWMFLAALAGLLLGATPAVHAQADDEGEGAKWSWFGALRVRPEYNDNLSDLYLGRDDNEKGSSRRGAQRHVGKNSLN